MDFVIARGPTPSLPVSGSRQLFPVRRIYCVGRNYAAHAREMGGDPEREAPFFFQKPSDAVVGPGTVIPYPPGTSNLHHEAELVVAIGQPLESARASDALAAVWGYGVGNDLTRRDLQLQAREKGRPWEVGKSFDHSAAVSALHPASRVGHLGRGRIELKLNGSIRQEADLNQMIWSVPEIIAELSMLFTLQPGDLIFTGTPEGVGPMVPGDSIEISIEGLDTLHHSIGPNFSGS